MASQVVLNCRDQILDAVEDSPAESVLGQITEKPFDHVEPRGAGRGKMNKESRMALQPGLDLGMLVGRIVPEYRTHYTSLSLFRRRQRANIIQGIRIHQATSMAMKPKEARLAMVRKVLPPKTLSFTR